MRKNNLIKLVGLVTALSITACMSGCGKQEEIVKAATIEEVTTVNENEDTEESVSVATEEETESIQESETDEVETESVTVQDFTITEMNKEMQATQNAVTFETPSADTAVGGVKQDEIVKVTGIVDGTDWYQIDQEGFKSFIDSKYLKEIEQQQPAQNENDNNNNQNPQVQTPAPEVQTPPAPENPQPPVVDPPADDSPVQMLPDGGFVTDSGVEIHPGYTDEYGNTFIGCGDDWFN